MSKHIRLLVALVALVVIGVSLALLAILRIREAKEFSQPHRVATYGGTNYVVGLEKIAVGKTATGCVLIVYLRLENPNPHDIALQRNWFIMVDQGKNYYLPSTTGTQTELIKLPANGVLEKEMLSFMVPDDAFVGTLALMIGQNYLVMVKDREPFTLHLHDGEFESFRRRDW